MKHGSQFDVPERRARTCVLTVDGAPGPRVDLAATWVRRLRGLFFSQAHALLIVPCDSVHSMGFSRPLEVAYLDSNGRVLVIKPLRAWWGLHFPVRSARAVVEASPGWLEAHRIAKGSVVEITRTGAAA